MSRRIVFVRNTLAVALAAVVGGSYVYFRGADLPSAHAAAINTPLVASNTGPTTPAGPVIAAATDFSGIVQRAGPAVVNISVTGKVKKVVDDSDDGDPDDPFSQFLKRFGPQLQIPRQPQVMHGLGSGFIISPDGVILTNAHVVEGAQEVVVKLTDRREFKAKVLGVDKQSDIAVIRIDARNLPTVQIGDPSNVKVGEPVLAIGSPYGFDNTATAGIISAKSRSLPDDNYVPFLQTDVAVNPGNSGGPLFNLKGEVIGINSQIYSQTGGFQGLSFAIPIDVAMKVEQQLAQHGKVTRGRLGVSVQDLNQALSESFGLKSAQGALISSVEKGSPADKAGLQAGDVILSFSGHAIDHSVDLPTLVADTAPGTSKSLEVMRDGKVRTINVTVGEMKSAKNDTPASKAENQGRLGLAVRPLDPDERKQLGGQNGLLVEDVNGPAAIAGIQSGDVILALNGTPVSSVEQLRKLASQVGKSVALLVERGDEKIFVPLALN
ncbi:MULTISPECIES: DegQ family serine endoprotease [unclassified Herbaspirillum]|uniref:DegQ family serine endoprotease n=1 Tax=unclassified Herbaspirillum TaxID=2624150 RepID=UPI001150CF34|nr:MULTISPECIES: DegQ family serine endoprotease [unclassified Herbaspirillum]MBB5390116.1 serine protease Do [Herbaspirillum sp. SJZ102]TQK09385.1 serine protease Do [Herbaspirillum sp. SJZ130]TQK13928.1 serine protease Do [Herbaspirillum sp. SJZ106]